MLDGGGHDMWMAARGLLRARGFSLAVVLTLALGVAGATVMFALIEGVLLRPMPVQDQDRLVVAWKELRLGNVAHWPITKSEIEAIRDGSRLVESVAGVSYNGAKDSPTTEDGRPFSLVGTYVTGDFFDVLDVEPLLGRTLKPADDVPGAEGVLVITHDLWQRRYGGSHDVLGRRLGEEHPLTIVGVMPPDVAYPRGVEAWTTVTTASARAANPTFRDAIPNELDLVARLRPGVSLDQARSELQALIGRLEADAPPGGPRDSRVVVQTWMDVVVGHVRTPMLALFAAVGLLLLIATANVANLLLLRGEARHGELAVRAALGARPFRLARQALAEGLLLGFGGGVVGLVAASLTLPAVVALVPGGLPRVESIRLDPAVALFALGAGVLAALLAAVAPALRSARLDVRAQLSGARQVGSTRGVQRGRRALVVAQVALALVVVAAATLLTRSVRRLEAVDMGMAADRLVLVGLAQPHRERSPEPGRHLRFLDDVVDELQAAPAIEAATPINNVPYSGTGGWDVGTFTAEGQGLDQVEANPSLNFEAVHPGYFDAFGVTVVRGRPFVDGDRQDAPAVVVLSEDVTTHLWPGEDPVGKRLKLGGPDSDDPWRTVVGVVGRTRYRELVDPRPTLYVPAEQLFVSADILAIRTPSPLGPLTDLIRERVAAVEPTVLVTWVTPFSTFVEQPMARPRFDAFLIGVFGVAALSLAVVGLYAVIGTWVRQRHGELGVRMALGATPSRIRRLVLGEGLRLAAAGAAIGLAGSALVSRHLEELLFEVAPLDPLSLLGAAGLLVVASLVASYLPARLATQVDPLEVLKGP